MRSTKTSNIIVGVEDISDSFESDVEEEVKMSKMSVMSSKLESKTAHHFKDFRKTVCFRCSKRIYKNCCQND
jgi:hypothetical protein